VAVLAQIASNFANDYFDFMKKADTEERLGPERAVASGRITPRAMWRAACLTLGAACLCGLGVCLASGWELLAVGILVALCVPAYSAGPYPLAYRGLGDVCVLLFYGVVPVCFTHYALTSSFTWTSFLLSLAVGFLSVNILVVNNYRDYREDRQTGKRTTVVRFGLRFGRAFYFINGVLAILLAAPLVLRAGWWTLFPLAVFFLLFLHTFRQLTLREGRRLNATLGHTARNVFVYTLLLIALWFF
jgi:1,4-dihydroxy-2-naphthoate octaprenyltransferase